MRNSIKYSFIIVIFLFIASFITFGRIAGNDFINFDDDQYITGNDNVKSGINTKNIHWAFTAVVLGNWHPFTMLSHTLDWSLFGIQAAGHHLVNLLLHTGSVILLFLFLHKTTKHLWPAAFAAALFALHPLRVESVAWAAERKDVLSVFFGMASIYCYAFYAGNRKLSGYLLSLLLFLSSLMSKPMLVTLPFILLLIDYWPLCRWQKALDLPGRQTRFIKILLAEKIPFLCLTVVSSIIALWSQQKAEAVAFGEGIPSVMRCANAVIAYVEYLIKIFWPANLAVFYPYEVSISLWKVFSYVFILTFITGAVVYWAKRIPFLFVGWFWYIGTLVPVIGLVQVGSQSMADRYTYLPSIGIAVILAWGIPLLFQHEYLRKKILYPVAIFAICILTVLTWKQSGYWKNSATLFSHALRVTHNNHTAHNNYGLCLFAEQKYEEAIEHFNRAIHLYPRRAAEFLNNRGLAYANLGRYQQAIKDYDAAIRLKPDLVANYNNRGIAYINLGQYQQAIDDYNQVIRLKPDHVFAYINRGDAYDALGRHQRAEDDYKAANRLNPGYADAYINRGIAYGRQGQYQLAIEDFSKAIRLNSDNAKAYSDRGFTYYHLGQYQQAIKDYNQAILLKPDYTDPYRNRAVVYLQQGNSRLGCFDARKACSLGNCETLRSAIKIGYCR